ncbi:hypothetical protein BG015_004937, partial [Linnemannia schmuckeri]
SDSKVKNSESINPKSSIKGVSTANTEVSIHGLSTLGNRSDDTGQAVSTITAKNPSSDVQASTLPSKPRLDVFASPYMGLVPLGTHMVDEFAADASKDSTKIAEMVLIGPVLDKEHFRRLLSCIITTFDQCVILDIDLLQGLVQLVQSAPPKSLVSDGLVKIFGLLRVRLQGAHQQSPVHSYHLTLAVARMLDVMADHKIKDLNRLDQILELKLYRQLILIYDGYDESQQLVNLHRTNMLNQPGQWNTKMSITCRTHDLEGDAESPGPPLLDADAPLFQRNLRSEPSIIQFLYDRVKSNPDFEQQLRAVIEQSKTDAGATTGAANAITILVQAGVSFNGADLRVTKIPGADLSEGRFDSAQFQGTDLTGANLSRS